MAYGGADGPRAQYASVPARRVPAWAASLLLHTGLLVALAFVLRFSPRAPLGESERTVGVALVRQSDGEREYVTSEEAQQEQQSSDSGVPADALPDESELTVDLSSVLPSAEDLAGAAAGVALPDVGDAGTRDEAGQGLSGAVSTSVFGVTGTGNKFVYVFDRSGSMAGYGGRPLASAKRELVTSLRELNETCQFQIIFYNERPKIFRSPSGTPQLAFGTEDEKERAMRFVTSISATGGTRHLDALRTAMRLNPDVIFFLTDADEPRLSDSELDRVRRLNRRAMINTIEFGYGPQHSSDNFLVRLAKQNGGQHVYVDVRRLPVR